MASYSVNLASQDEFLDELLLEKTLKDDESILENVLKAHQISKAVHKKPCHYLSLHLDVIVGEPSNSESSSSSVQVYERPELEYIHPVVVYHAISRLKRNKVVTLKDLNEILAIKQVKAKCTPKQVNSLSKDQIIDQMEFCMDALRELLADQKVSSAQEPLQTSTAQST